MLDVFIILGLILGIFFLLLGKQWMHEWPFYLSAGIFLIIGAGILLTGWETFDLGNSFIISEVVTGTSGCVDTVDGFCELIQTQIKLFPATLEENPLLLLLGTIFVAFGLVFVFLGLEEAGRNKAAREME
ncbi:hypothetical protein GOV13_02745 [Candidatus Pacearchaeota archaeon]|nr:hypothetical protein [Candidatus Pacearchaeota archaeon]